MLSVTPRLRVLVGPLGYDPRSDGVRVRYVANYTKDRCFELDCLVYLLLLWKLHVSIATLILYVMRHNLNVLSDIIVRVVVPFLLITLSSQNENVLSNKK